MLLITASILFAAPFLSHARTARTCGWPDHQLSNYTKQLTESELQGTWPGPMVHTFTIDTYVHIVGTEKKPSSWWNTTNDQAELQMRVLNDKFERSGFNFNLVNISRTVNDTWASYDKDVASMNGDDEAEYQMKRQLRKGGYADLNVYFLSEMLTDGHSGNMGWSRPPLLKKDVTPDMLAMDGSAIATRTMPGAEEEDYNMGYTTVHEVGHWLNLLHTFEGKACKGPGDYVSDTPQQRSSTKGCPSKAPDTCPDDAGPDAIHNMMDYSYDHCMQNFTDGQLERMWRSYRGRRAGWRVPTHSQ